MLGRRLAGWAEAREAVPAVAAAPAASVDVRMKLRRDWVRSIMAEPTLAKAAPFGK